MSAEQSDGRARCSVQVEAGKCSQHQDYGGDARWSAGCHGLGAVFEQADAVDITADADDDGEATEYTQRD